MPVSSTFRRFRPAATLTLAFTVLATAAAAQTGPPRSAQPAEADSVERAPGISPFARLKSIFARQRPDPGSDSRPQAPAASPFGPALPDSQSGGPAGAVRSSAPRISFGAPEAAADDLLNVDPSLPVMLPQPDSESLSTAYEDSPEKRITDILPYADYEPDPEIRRTDPLRNQCPNPDNLCPPEIRLSQALWTPREIAPSIFTWEASNLYHYPLYFEDPPLERYGHTHGCLIQPFASVGRFNLQLLGLPYQMTIDPACRKIYTLGWYRPGECAPKLHYQIPWHHQAAINQALVTTGLFYLIP